MNDQARIDRANNPEARKRRQGMYDDLEIQAFDLISMLKACEYTKAEAIQCFSDLWDRVRIPDAKVYLCTICGKNSVDAENGYDTCQKCLDSR